MGRAGLGSPRDFGPGDSLPAFPSRTSLVTLGAAAALAWAMPAGAAVITSAPAPLSNQNPSVAWAPTAGGTTFTWRLVNTGTGATVGSDSGPATSAGPIAVGSGTYRFDVDETPPATAPPTDPPPTESVAFTVDKIPPILRRQFLDPINSAPVTPNAAGWVRQAVVVHYDCMPEDAAPCPADEGPFEHPTKDTPLPEHTVSDAAGNTTTVPAMFLGVDNQPPAMYFAVPPSNGPLDGPSAWTWTGTSLAPGGGSPRIELGPASAFTFTPGCAIDRETSGLAGCTTTMRIGTRTVNLAPQQGPLGSGTPVTDAIPMTRDATQLGDRVITYAGSDVAGNTNAKTVRYTVVDTIAPGKPMPTMPAETVNTRRPTFSWPRSTETGTGMQRYEVWIDNAKSFEVKPLSSNGLELAEYSIPLPDLEFIDENNNGRLDTGEKVTQQKVPDLSSGQHTWQLRAVDGAGLTSRSDTIAFRVDTTAPDAPQVSGPSGLVATRTPVFQASGLPNAMFSWVLEGFVPDGSTTPVQSGAPSPSGTVAPSALDDGAYRLKVRQRNALGTDGQYAIVLFTVDGTPPPAPAGLTGASADGDAQPVFTWTAGEPGGTFRWQVLGPAGDTRLGPGSVAAAPMRLPAALPPGAYTFRLVQADAAGNLSAPADVAFRVAAPPAPGPVPAPIAGAPPATTTSVRPGTTKLVVATIGAARSRPKAGATVRTLAPRLSWPRYRGATVYNVQVYRMQGTRFVKVVSAFPRRNAYVVSAKKLKKGQRYLWRVWPYIGARKRYTATAKAQSWFTVSRTAKAPVKKRVTRTKR